MQRDTYLLFIFATSLSACGSSQSVRIATQVPTNENTLISDTAVSESTFEYKTLETIPIITPLPEPCSTPIPNELNDFINRSITYKDNGETLFLHVTTRFWIYLDDRLFPLRDLFNSIPDDLLGYISNGSIRGPQCYPIMFEAVREGKGLLQIKDFQLSIIIDNNVPESPLPLN